MEKHHIEVMLSEEKVDASWVNRSVVIMQEKAFI